MGNSQRRNQHLRTYLRRRALQQYVTVKKSFTIVTKLFILDVSGSHGYTYDCKQLIQSMQHAEATTGRVLLKKSS